MAVDPIQLLEGFLRTHERLKAEDEEVVTDLCEKLRIRDEVGLINDYFRTQVEVEASIVYLLSKYERILSKLRFNLEEHRAGAFVELGERNDEGLKWTKQAKEQWVMATDAKYLTQSETLSTMESLYNSLQRLSNIVFRRDGKLEQLSINYRREMEADKRTTGY